MTAPLPVVEVVLAVYRPKLAALERQVHSVICQHGCQPRVHLFVDGPMPQLPEIRTFAGREAQVSLTEFPENRGAATTFVEGLSHVLTQGQGPEARYFAFCDQDDIWHPRKLATSLAVLRADGVACVHSDMRVVDGDLQEIANSLFAFERRQTQPGLSDLFFRNNATGMTMLFDQGLAGRVVELGSLRPRRWLHDHFTAFLAACGEGLAFCGEPLADYVQHGGNAVGAGPETFHWPAGGFLDSRGDAAELLASAHGLLGRLLASDWLSEAARCELENLYRLLGAKGLRSLPDCVRTLRTIRAVPRDLLARLIWSKLIG